MRIGKQDSRPPEPSAGLRARPLSIPNGARRARDPGQAEASGTYLPATLLFHADVLEHLRQSLAAHRRKGFTVPFQGMDLGFAPVRRTSARISRPRAHRLAATPTPALSSDLPGTCSALLKIADGSDQTTCLASAVEKGTWRESRTAPAAVSRNESRASNALLKPSTITWEAWPSKTFPFLGNAACESEDLLQSSQIPRNSHVPRGKAETDVRTFSIPANLHCSARRSALLAFSRPLFLPRRFCSRRLPR